MKKVFGIMIMLCIVLSSYASDKNTNENATASSGKMVEVYTVKGMVTDEAGESLPGVTVMVNGKKVFTDLDGQFKVSGVCKDCNIQISNHKLFLLMLQARKN